MKKISRERDRNCKDHEKKRYIVENEINLANMKCTKIEKLWIKFIYAEVTMNTRNGEKAQEVCLE